MQIYNSDITLRVSRITVIQDRRIMIGDQIPVGKYTATCQAATQEGAIFLLDQCLDRAYPMNEEGANGGRYDRSSLRRVLQNEEVLAIFEEYRDRMQPFNNSDLLRIPFAGEIFQYVNSVRVESDACKQWPLMRERRNRIAFRNEAPEWSWLQNKMLGSRDRFGAIDSKGCSSEWDASRPLGVRPVFCIK